VIIDGHNDLVLHRWRGEPSDHLDLDVAKAASFAGGFFALYIPSPPVPDPAETPYALPLPATIECSRVWAGEPGSDRPEHLATLWAIESMSASTSRLKLAGLLEHYGFDDGASTEYLWRRATGDGEKCLLASGWLADSLFEGDSIAMLEQVEAVHRAHWLMLDDLEAVGARG